MLWRRRMGASVAGMAAALACAGACGPAARAEGPAAGGARARLPVYVCRRVSRDIALTGRMGDPLWRQAQAVSLVGPVDGRPGRFRTTARLLYNSRYLYIAFDCEDDYVWGTMTARDAPIYEEECVEAFLAPSGRTRQYYEFEVSPLNTVLDVLVLNARPVSGASAFVQKWFDYTCEGLVTKVEVRGQLGVRGARGWSAEMAIPFTSIPGGDDVVPRPGDLWRMNLYRCDALAPGRQEFYAWSAPGAEDFHVPWRFGYLRFAR